MSDLFDEILLDLLESDSDSLDNQQLSTSAGSNVSLCEIEDRSSQKKKPNPRDRAKSMIPRVVKADIRRRFVPMFFNLINSFDTVLLEKFLYKYFRPDVRFSHCCPVISGKMLYGIPQKLDMWRGKFAVMPDLSFRMNSCKVITRSDSERSEVLASVSCTGTTLYDLPLEIWMPAYVEQEDQSVCPPVGTKRENPNSSAYRDSGAPYRSVPKYHKNHQLKACDGDIFRHDLTLRAIPGITNATCTLRLLFDENKYIQAFECIQ